MNILLLEDDTEKQEKIQTAVREFMPAARIQSVSNWLDYSKQINSVKFDLILLDLMVPRSPKDPRVEDHHVQLVETTRSFDSKSFRTPAIVLTQYLDQSEAFFQALNRVDINVISFDQEGAWKDALRLKMHAAEPKVKFDFVVLCALPQEAMAYQQEVDSFGELRTMSDLLCREIRIAGRDGVIVQSGRMGLVAGAVTASLAIERFEPGLICMSGICGGVPGESSVYDVLVTDVCHQHDVGKWSDTGFKSEHYDVQVDASLRNKLEELIESHAVRGRLSEGISLKRSEFPDGTEDFATRFRIVPTSSGSAVIAEEGKTASLSAGQRKLAGFDMEVFSLYEAARLSARKPLYFAAKTVVDDGDKNKGDRFHRVGCLLSARFVVEAIRSGILPPD